MQYHRKTQKSIINTIKGTLTLDKVANFNPFPNSTHSYKMPFYIFKFHDFFDGLIGYESLQKINATIDTSSNTLKLPDIDVQMFKKYPDNQTVNLNANETRTIQVPIFNSNSDFLLEEDLLIQPSVFIHAGIYHCENNSAHVLVTNQSEDDISFTFPDINLELNNFDECETPLDRSDFIDPHLIKQIRSEHLNREEKKNLFRVLSKYKHVFHQEHEDLTFSNAVKHSINTTDEIPIHTKSYRYPYCHKEEVQKQIQEMLRQGIIRHSHSPWSAPIWVVPKKKDASGKQKWRLVIDYRKLNQKTIDDRYPIPDITSILDKLGKCQYYSTLDLASGFHQIEIDTKDISKTAFSVEHGHYEFVRMPFGLKNAPSTFQRVMDNVLREHLGKHCLIYMDDIIIFSTSLQEHLTNLSQILKTLAKFNLKVQLDKSEFLCKEVAFLGHIVTPEGVKPNPDKLVAINDWPIPTNETELRGFLGTLGYYRRFIKDYAKIVRPLFLPLKKNEKVTHTKEFIQTFEKCKTLLTSSSILQYPDFEKPFILTTDASSFAIGSVLSQGPIGKDRPVAFASRTLRNSEINYSVIEKELLAIVWACKYFRPYLFGRKFTLYTDHKPLEYIFNLKDPNSKLVRWRLSLEEFDYEIKYRPGKQNVVADGLSRISTEINANLEEQSSTDDSMSPNLPNSNQSETSDDATMHSANTDDSHFIHMTEKPVNIFSNQLIFKIDSEEQSNFEQVFPKIFRHTVTKIAFSVPTILKIFQEQLDPNRVNCIYCPETLIPIIQFVYKNYFSRNKNLKIVISQLLLEDLKTLEQQNETITEIHNRAHRGIQENYKVLSQKFFFPKMKQKLHNHISLCENCNKGKYDRKPYKINLAETPIPKKPLDIVHMDIFISGQLYFLSFIDKLSKFGTLIPIKSRSILDIRTGITKFISTYGTPKLIVSDNEPSFKSTEIRGLFQTLGIETYYTPVDHSQTNGTVERFHSTIIEIFRCKKPDLTDLSDKEIFRLAVGLYNSTIHTSHNLKPMEVFYGIKDNEERPLNLETILENRNKLFDEIILELQKKQQKDLNCHNRSRQEEPQLSPNQDVFLKRQGIKSKTKSKFNKIKVLTQRRKTFMDTKNRKLHKSQIKRRKIVANENPIQAPIASTSQIIEP